MATSTARSAVVSATAGAEGGGATVAAAAGAAVGAAGANAPADTGFAAATATGAGAGAAGGGATGDGGIRIGNCSAGVAVGVGNIARTTPFSNRSGFIGPGEAASIPTAAATETLTRPADPSATAAIAARVKHRHMKSPLSL